MVQDKDQRASIPYVLVLSCADQVGIVAAVSACIAAFGGSIIEAQQHLERETGRFFMRLEIQAVDARFVPRLFQQRFTELAQQYQMQWRWKRQDIRPRVAIFCSHQVHCVYDLLARFVAQDFCFDVVCVISNHESLRTLVEGHGIAFYYLPMTAENKMAQFERYFEIVQHLGVDTIVLARFMQIIPPFFCQEYLHRIINIHHGFLPSFVGAKPYHQAYLHGVKMIGATCHYVTSELDAGPIIEQDVVRIAHSDTPQSMINCGKDVEKSVLARGVRFHVENRVLVDGRRTVIFR